MRQHPASAHTPRPPPLRLPEGHTRRPQAARAAPPAPPGRTSASRQLPAASPPPHHTPWRSVPPAGIPPPCAATACPRTPPPSAQQQVGEWRVAWGMGSMRRCWQQRPVSLKPCPSCSATAAMPRCWLSAEGRGPLSRCPLITCAPCPRCAHAAYHSGVPLTPGALSAPGTLAGSRRRSGRRRRLTAACRGLCS